jgi:hypothetical protein
MSDKKLSPLRQKDLRTGAQQERERILELWEAEMKCGCISPMKHFESRLRGEITIG